MPKVFVSYRREDSIDAAGRLYDRLTAQFGRESVFMDVDSIPFGVDFRTFLADWSASVTCSSQSSVMPGLRPAMPTEISGWASPGDFVTIGVVRCIATRGTRDSGPGRKSRHAPTRRAAGSSV